MLLNESPSFKRPEKAVIVSDLHVGSRFFLCQDFERFFEGISVEYEIILNGDIIDNPHKALGPSHRRVLDLIGEISYTQRVVWVRGNHDNGYVPKRMGNVFFRRFYSIGRKLLIVHGDDFDRIMTKTQIFIKVFNLMHQIRLKLGARPVHVAHYAKKWPAFYNVLRRHVMNNAVNCARENGYEAVTCGHTHYPEDRIINGIRYINTGAWTELPAFYLKLNAEELALIEVDH